MSADQYLQDPQQQDPTVDPNSPPADPMLQQEPPPDQSDLSQHDEPPNPYLTGEATTRDRVEICVILTIETLAKACQVGVGASNMDFAIKAGQAAASFGQCYASLAGIELQEAQGQISSLSMADPMTTDPSPQGA